MVNRTVPIRDALLIMGNGPSLAQLNDFHILDRYAIDTIGMNSAYRYWEKLSWYPKYYCSFDHVVTECHSTNLVRMINDPSISIEKYFLLKRICSSPKLQVVRIKQKKIGSFSTSFENFGYGGGTGQCAAELGVCMGYKKLFLIGIDANYTEFIDECQEKIIDGKKVLQIKKTPKKNLNYFFDDYQQEGDVYNIPQCEKYHMAPWAKFAEFAKKNQIEVTNCGGAQSKIKVFNRKTIYEALAPYKL